MHRFWDVRLQKCRDLETRSLEISPYDRVHTTSYWRSVVTMALSRVVSEIFNVKKCRDLEIGVSGHSGSLKVVPLDRLFVYGFLLVFFSNFVPKTHRFWDIRLLSTQWPWKPGWGSLKVIANYTIQSGTHDFLLTFHSNHRPIWHRFRDKRRCPLKITQKSPIFPTPVYLTSPLKGFSVELCIGAGISRN